MGAKKIVFFAEPRRVNDKNYSMVCYRIGSKKVDTGFALEYGELDWSAVDMALREFVSNAVDSVEDSNEVRIEIVENARVKSGKTRIFVPLTPSVQKFYNELFDRFLMFDERKNKKILEKTSPGPAKVYRKGVLVRQLSDDKEPSLFDYNLGEELKIDESRNLDDYAVTTTCARAIRTNKDCLSSTFKSLANNNKVWEHRFNRYSLTSHYDNSIKPVWQDAWKETFGEAYLCQSVDTIATERAKRKGHSVIEIENSEWYEACRSNGVPTVYDLLTEDETRGIDCCNATPDATRILNEVWGWFVALEMTKGKYKPSLKCFTQIKSGSEGTILGYLKDDTIFINVEFETNYKTYVEELIHYAGDVEDFCRNWQEFAISMIVGACKEQLK